MIETPIALGLIGAGDVVQRFYLPALAERPRFRIAAVASAGGRSARALAERHQIPTVCDSAAALIARPDVDAVAICTPPDSHRALGVAALAAGKHVLVEKPIAPRYDDAAALLAAVEGAAGILYYTFNNRLREENQHLATRVLSGALGALECIDVEWLRTKPPGAADWCRDAARAGGGVLADLGSHLIMIALGLVPDRTRFVARCRLQRRTEQPGAPEDFAVADVTIDGHLPLLLKAGWGIALERTAIVNLRAFGRAGMATNLDYQGAMGDGYGAVLDRFAAHVTAGKQPDLGIADDAARLLQALYDAARTGDAVTGRFRGGAWS